jgi:hypothetical protein
MTVLSVKGEELLEDLPPYLEEDTVVQGIVDSGARELERIETFLEVLRTKTFPQNADDEYRLLALWEEALGLPIEPEGVAVVDRQRKVMATIRRRYAGRGAAWVEMLTEALGSAAWNYAENVPNPYWLSIQVQIGTSMYTRGQVWQLLRQVTPAHLLIAIDWGEGFRVGSLVGDPL